MRTAFYSNQERLMILAAIQNGELTKKINDFCPYCRSYLMTNGEINWCANIGCTYSNDQDFKSFLQSLYQPSDYTQLKMWED